MTVLLLDTTALIDAERGQDSLDRLIGDDDTVAIAAVTADPRGFEGLTGVFVTTYR